MNSFNRKEEWKGRDVRATACIKSFLVDAAADLYLLPNGSDFDKEWNGVTPLIRNVNVHDAINNGLGV